jgi:hypothetical protein
MKFALLLFMAMATHAFAADICQFEETWEFTQGVRPVRVSNNHKKFSTVEKHLIHKTVTLQDWKKNIELKESLLDFGDYEDGKPGVNAGEIRYYNFEGKQYLLVHYWPGDNEYGAYFTINKNGSFKLVAIINDGFIECK